MKIKVLILVPLTAGLLASAQAATIIDTVVVGNLGNFNDSTGYGGVSYSYAIGKYEVTLNQYTDFLNAVADTDSFGLYHASMGTDRNIAGIQRTGLPDAYSYEVLGDGNRPVTYVSWFDAARFTNWLHNGQPTGLQVAGTTERGAYTLHGALSGANFSTNGLAQWWIPSEDEWYKAAYFQPAATALEADKYWLYPTVSNTVPNSRNGSGSDANSGNFKNDDSLANGFNGGYAVSNLAGYSASHNYLTAGGAFTQADSYYGTFDQGGNVYEWNDALITSSRGLRGGSWNYDAITLQASTGAGVDPAIENSSIGFRVATIPEPGVSVSLVLAGGLLLARRKRPSAF